MFAPNQPPQQPSPEQVAAGCRGCITAVGGFVGVCVGTIFLGGLVVGTATHHLEVQKKKTAPRCPFCSGRGLSPCKTCRAEGSLPGKNASTEIRYQCPTCDGRRLQKCLNCVGKGYV